MIKPIINEAFADNGAHSHWEVIDANNGKILWSEQLATDGREELEKKVKELEEMFDTNWMEKYFIAFDQITALQSQCTEKEKECDELKANKQNYQETVLHHFEEIEALKKGLRKIEQMSDPGSPEAGIVYMKNIASELLKQSP